MADVLYLCDRLKCDKCYSSCKYTSDIKHAVNFNLVGGDKEYTYFEIDDEDVIKKDQGVMSDVVIH